MKHYRKSKIFILSMFLYSPYFFSCKKQALNEEEDSSEKADFQSIKEQDPDSPAGDLKIPKQKILQLALESEHMYDFEDKLNELYNDPHFNNDAGMETIHIAEREEKIEDERVLHFDIYLMKENGLSLSEDELPSNKTYDRPPFTPPTKKIPTATISSSYRGSSCKSLTLEGVITKPLCNHTTRVFWWKVNHEEYSSNRKRIGGPIGPYLQKNQKVETVAAAAGGALAAKASGTRSLNKEQSKNSSQTTQQTSSKSEIKDVDKDSSSNSGGGASGSGTSSSSARTSSRASGGK